MPPPGAPGARPASERFFLSLDRPWLFLDDPDGTLGESGEVVWDEQRQIRVPFAPETPLSGVNEPRLRQGCRYRTEVSLPRLPGDDRLRLSFGAVDDKATILVDDEIVATHQGGYEPFSVDLTRFAGQDIVLEVRAFDDPADLGKPRGKQTWREEPHRFFYPGTTGMWDSVFVEQLPAVSIDAVRWRAEFDDDFVVMTAVLSGQAEPGSRIGVRLLARGHVLASLDVPAEEAQAGVRIPLDPEMLRRLGGLVWNPENPVLLDATVALRDAAGTVRHVRGSAVGRRTVAVRDGRFELNGEPRFLRGVLHQGYWPESGLTPSDDAALRRDVALIRGMGFDTARLHQAVMTPRLLDWCDRLGLMVFDEMPSSHDQLSADGEDVRHPSYTLNPGAPDRLLSLWRHLLERGLSHPSVIVNVFANESWGLGNLDGDADRHRTERTPSELTLRGRLTRTVSSVYHRTVARLPLPDLQGHGPDVERQRNVLRRAAAIADEVAPGRLTILNDGWQTLLGSIIGVHDYGFQPTRMFVYAADRLAGTIRHNPNSRRALALDKHQNGRAVMITEFGGVQYEPGSSGSPAASGADGPGSMHAAEREFHDPQVRTEVGDWRGFVAEVAARIRVIEEVGTLSGFVYTQDFDQYQEDNGLAYFDRSLKGPLEDIRRAVMGTDYVPLPDSGPVADAIRADPVLRNCLGMSAAVPAESRPSGSRRGAGRPATRKAVDPRPPATPGQPSSAVTATRSAPYSSRPAKNQP